MKKKKPSSQDVSNNERLLSLLIVSLLKDGVDPKIISVQK
jgi:hypothetical protein